MTYLCEAGHTTDANGALAVISCPYLIGRQLRCSRLARPTTTSRQGSRQTSARATQRQMTLGEDQ